MKLREIAYARSGDKGHSVNIGVLAREPKWFEALLASLTEERVQKHFAKLAPIDVKRYSLPKIHGLNFVLKGVLEGGGNRSLRLDAQGKALGQALLEMEINL